MPNIWRLIPLMKAPGKVQMAIDNWLLEQHRLNLHPPTLRFYTWSPAAISLGYHQQRWPNFWENLTWQGSPVELVRRPSGGRAVLHQGDLTYAVITSEIKGTRIEAYQRICEFLIQGWRSLGVELYYGSAGRGYIHNPSCFGTATGADLVTIDNYKLIGSAQLRRSNTILQHGSIRLSPDTTLFKQVFAEELTSINLPLFQQQEALIKTVIDSLTQAAADCFNIQLVPQTLSPEELQALLSKHTLNLNNQNFDL